MNNNKESLFLPISINASMEVFIQFVKKYSTISKEAEEAFIAKSKVEVLEKGAPLFEEGKTCRRIYFIVSGTARTFFYLDGKEITYWVYPEQSFVTSWHSFIMQVPSKEYGEVIENAKIVSFTSEDWEDLHETYPGIQRFGRYLMTEQLALVDDFYKGYHFMTAKQKYDLLIEFFPDVTLRANLGYIASMLGISQETLSRIRGKKA